MLSIKSLKMKKVKDFFPSNKRFIRDRRPGILVVDDEERICRLYRVILEEEEGYIVHTAMSGEEGLKIFDLAIHLGEPKIDLVILDIMMPRMDGIEVLKRIRQKKHNFPVIICSALNRYNREWEGDWWGPDDYIEKPFDLCELIQSLRRLLAN